MHYAAFTRKEGKFTLVEFPDCPGCQTFVERGEDLATTAREALVGWLEATLDAGDLPPRPRRRVKARGKAILVAVPLKLSVSILLRWARHDAGLTQAELARKVHVSQQQIAKLEDPDANPTIDTLTRVAKALGLELEVGVAERGTQAS